MSFAELLCACKAGCARHVERLLNDPRVDPTECNNAAIREAARRGHADVVRALLCDGRADPMARYGETVRATIEEGHTRVARMLLDDPRVDPAAYDNVFIRIAAEKGRTDIVRMLLAEERVDPMTRCNRPLCLALFNNHESTAQLLLDNERVNPNVFGRELFYSAQKPYYMHLLLDHPRLDATKAWLYVLDAAAGLGCIDVVRRVLALTPDPTEMGSSVADPLASAVQSGDADIVRILLDDDRVPVRDGGTGALETAAMSYRDEAMRLLLADPRVDPRQLSVEQAMKMLGNTDHKCAALLLTDARIRDGVVGAHTAMVVALVNCNRDKIWNIFFRRTGLPQEYALTMRFILGLGPATRLAAIAREYLTRKELQTPPSKYNMATWFDDVVLARLDRELTAVAPISSITMMIVKQRLQAARRAWEWRVACVLGGYF